MFSKWTCLNLNNLNLVHLQVKDGKFGAKKSDGSWSGMIGDVLDRQQVILLPFLLITSGCRYHSKKLLLCRQHPEKSSENMCNVETFKRSHSTKLKNVLVLSDTWKATLNSHRQPMWNFSHNFVISSKLHVISELSSAYLR